MILRHVEGVLERRSKQVIPVAVCSRRGKKRGRRKEIGNKKKSDQKQVTDRKIKEYKELSPNAYGLIKPSWTPDPLGLQEVRCPKRGKRGNIKRGDVLRGTWRKREGGSKDPGKPRRK